ncbi:MAG: hypothetical protein GY804_10470 [Alphaproteobacteria bacterium]|nr:hypothetical protein [Alphaproteobacteria bacterium]
MLKAKKWKSIAASSLLLSVILCACNGAHLKEQDGMEVVVNVEPELDPVKIGRVSFSMQKGERIGTYLRTGKCSPRGRSLQWQRGRMWNLGRVRLDKINFKDNLGSELTKKDYDVVYSHNKAAAFGINAGFVVDVEIESVNMDVCDAYNPFKDEMLGVQYGNAEVNVLWTVRSLKNDKLVYSAETSAIATLEEGEENGETELLRRAFNLNIGSFVKDVALFTALNDGVSYEEFKNSEYVKAKKMAELERIAAEKRKKEEEKNRIEEERRLFTLQKENAIKAAALADKHKAEIEKQIRLAVEKRIKAEQAAHIAELELKKQEAIFQEEQKRKHEIIAQIDAEKKKAEQEKEQLEKAKTVAEQELKQADAAVDAARTKRLEEEKAVSVAIEKQHTAEEAAKIAANKSQEAENTKIEAEKLVVRAKEAIVKAELQAAEAKKIADKENEKAHYIRSKEAELKKLIEEKLKMEDVLLSAEATRKEIAKVAKLAADERKKSEMAAKRAATERVKAEQAMRKATAERKKAEEVLSNVKTTARKVKRKNIAVNKKIVTKTVAIPNPVSALENISLRAEKLIAKGTDILVGENKIEKVSKPTNGPASNNQTIDSDGAKFKVIKVNGIPRLQRITVTQKKIN